MAVTVTAAMVARARREGRREAAKDVTNALMPASAVMPAPVTAVRAPARYDSTRFLSMNNFMQSKKKMYCCL